MGCSTKASRAARTWGMALGPARSSERASSALLSAAKQVASKSPSASSGSSQGERSASLRCHSSWSGLPGKRIGTRSSPSSSARSSPSRVAVVKVRFPASTLARTHRPGCLRRSTITGLPGTSRMTSYSQPMMPISSMGALEASSRQERKGGTVTSTFAPHS